MNIQSLYQTIKALRHPKDGCPWDLKQTHLSLTRFLEEECYEVIHAIESGDFHELKDELGDVLLQVLLHSIIAEENNQFQLQEVMDNLEEKIIRRHPHVFSEEKVKTVEEVKRNWKEIKRREKEFSNKEESHFIPKKNIALPPLKSSYAIGEYTNEKKFDWSKPEEVMEKVNEEVRELNLELDKNQKNLGKVKEELGDVLFTLSQLGRHLEICPDEALKEANKKFVLRYNKMIELNDKNDIKDLSPEGKENLWKKVKDLERE